jgi:hypothetical protein
VLVAAMAFKYYRSISCGSAITAMHNDEEIEACVLIVATMTQKRRWGGYVVGHRSKKRDCISDDIRLNNDYFIERALFNSEEFHRRYNATAISLLL